MEDGFAPSGWHASAGSRPRASSGNSSGFGCKVKWLKIRVRFMIIPGLKVYGEGLGFPCSLASSLSAVLL